MSSQERVKIFIDGSNFFYYCKELGIPSYPKFDFELFVKDLVNGRDLVEKVYYIGAVRAKPGNKKAMKMMSKQMSFFSYLKKNGWKINKGFLLKSHGRHHEKGVDVKLALDIALGAVDDIFDTAILVSSDTDILPAIDYAQQRKKKVEYIGFSYRPSMALVAKADVRRLLTKSEFDRCCK